MDSEQGALSWDLHQQEPEGPTPPPAKRISLARPSDQLLIEAEGSALPCGFIRHLPWHRNSVRLPTLQELEPDSIISGSPYTDVLWSFRSTSVPYHLGTCGIANKRE
jgi:hypothetical protein